jgi:2-polyprenyl-3-methyl-5-hydroxy-6-metoxy-1,4-benzoquinol methylase
MDYARYFSKKSSAWIKAAYSSSGSGDYYPVGLHRLRVVSGILKGKAITRTTSLLDMGCGGGHVSIAMARKGYRVDAIDRSASMLKTARLNAKSLPRKVSDRLSFYQCGFDQLAQTVEGKKYDVIIALGFIGYLNSDENLFDAFAPLLKKSGLLIVSCRNRLFNMFPGSKYMREEIRKGTALALLDEIDALYQKKIGERSFKYFLQNMRYVATHLSSKSLISGQGASKNKEQKNFTSDVNPRQHTPSQLINVAKKFGLVSQGLYAVHPHLLSSKAKALFPEGAYHQLSDALCAFESEPAALAWSSVFIANFKKISRLLEA